MRTRIFVTAVMCMIASTVYAGGLNSEEQNFTRAFEVFRSKYQLAMPNLDPALVAGSQAWSARMRTYCRFSHGAGYENIYMGQASGTAAFRAWEKSKAHRALLLSPSVTSFGIGQSGGYWTFRAKTKARETVTKPVVPACVPAVPACAPVSRSVYDLFAD